MIHFSITILLSQKQQAGKKILLLTEEQKLLARLFQLGC